MEFRAGKWSNVLRNAAMSDPRSNYQIGKDAKIDQGQLSRFLRLGRGLSLEAAERLAWVLGVKLSMTGDQGEAIGVEMYEPPRGPIAFPPDDGPEERLPVDGVTVVEDDPQDVQERVTKSMEVKASRPAKAHVPSPISNALHPSAKRLMTPAEIAKRKRLGMSD